MGSVKFFCKSRFFHDKTKLMVVGQQHAVRFLVCNITRLHASMSRTDAQKCSEPVRPRAENAALSDKPAVRGRGGDFFAIRMRKKYYSLSDCLDGLCSAGYNQSGDGRGICLFLLRSHPARRRGYGSAGRTCSVQVGRIEGVKQFYHRYYRSSSPIRSTRVLWQPPQQQHFVSFRVWLTYSICSEA